YFMRPFGRAAPFIHCRPEDKRMAKHWMAMICCALCVTAACPAEPPTSASEDVPMKTGRAPPTRIPDPVEPTVAPQGAPVTAAQMAHERRQAVVEDAARRFKVEASAVVLTRAEQVTWPNGSLGCPEPGRMYTQMLVPGYRVVAKTTAGEMTYHTDARGNVVNCASRLPRKAVEGAQDSAK